MTLAQRTRLLFKGLWFFTSLVTGKQFLLGNSKFPAKSCTVQYGGKKLYRKQQALAMRSKYAI